MYIQSVWEEDAEIWTQMEVAEGWKESAKQKTGNLISAPNIIRIKSNSIKRKGM